MASVLLLLMSSIPIAINYFYTQYPGNNYFPPGTLLIAMLLMLLYSGCVLQFGVKSQFATQFKEVLIFFWVMTVITFATNSVQYTPFLPIDDQILRIDSSHFIINQSLHWINQHVLFKRLLEWAYNTLAYQMGYFPLFFIMIKRYEAVHKYYLFLLLSTLIGFTFYYFFPTIAPATCIDSPYFSEAQKATGLKYMQIHHHIPPTTLMGGLIAFPSFHTIWAWFCLYLLKDWPIIWSFVALVNALLVASCVLLGWHYPLDILGGVIVILLTHRLAKRFNTIPKVSVDE